MRLLRREKARITLCLLVAFIGGVLIWQNQDHDGKINTKYIFEERFCRNQVLIHQNLFAIYKQYSSKSVNEAQNTFMDLKQFWQMQDVLAASLNKKNYLISDSLQSLEILVDQPFSYPNSMSVRQEIKRNPVYRYRCI